ncbi:MAG: polyphosphate kinase 2 family protein [Propionibacteriaceae bacterium]|jgi:PPK2 family polyphosphate:nucleotide phosphotransferase|nr:polyphosphate kinase 2 family protein [Propionibacteriaceae bacterium]
MGKKKHHSITPLSQLLRVPAGPVSLARYDSKATPGYPGKGRDDADKFTTAILPELSDLQERLYASSQTDPANAPRILIVLQGMDTSGKGGVIRHSIGLVDPQGVQIKAFKVPTAEERAHDYLWRIRNALPAPGKIGIFDRSHYEDVLVVRVDGLFPESVWSKRYGEINDFEAELVASGTRLIKCMLNVSYEEQRERLLARLDDPTKHWKFSASDLDSRAKWPDYMEAYEAALTLCNTEVAPWHIIPADHKWYRNWAVTELLREVLEGLDLQWPVADYDVAEQRRRLAALD